MMSFLLVSSFFSIFNVCSGAPEILEPLVDQYGLIGNNITVSCNTRGTHAFWTLNKTSITVSHLQTTEYYKNIGVVFTEIQSNGYYNLTMVAPAVLPMNNTNISCTARDSGVKMSNVVYMIIFNTVSPYPPSVNGEVYYFRSSSPIIIATIQGLPRWQGQEISEYTVNITETKNNSLLYQDTILNILVNNTAVFSTSLRSSVAQECNTLRISVAAVSNTHGESEPTQIDLKLIKAIGELLNDSLKCTTLFYPNGTLFQLLVQVQLPDVCSYQQVNYTIIVEEETNNTTADAMNALLYGPYYHQGPDMVSHPISGLKKGREYSARVQVNHVTGITESAKNYFDTELHLTYSAIPCNKSNLKGTDDLSFKLAIGVSLCTLALLLMSLFVTFTCFCVRTQRLRKRLQNECRTNNRPMIHNPLYDGNGPMYESISGDMVQCRRDPIQATATASECTRETVQSGRYVGEPTQLLFSQNQQKKPALQQDAYDHLMDYKGSGIEPTVQSNIEIEETYTFMSPAGTLTANNS